MMSNIKLKNPKGRTRIAVKVFYFVQGLCLASWSSRIADTKTHLQLSDLELGNILFLMGIGQLITLPFSNLLISKYSSKVILIIGSIGISTILLTLSMPTSITQLIVSLTLFGIFGNFMHISLNTQGVLAEKFYNKILMSTFHGIWSISGLIGAVIGTAAIYFKLSIPQHFLIISILTLTLILTNYKYLFPDTLLLKNEETLTTFKIKKPEFLLLKLGFIGFCGLMIEGTIYDWSGIFFKEVIKAPAQFITIGYTAFMTTLAFGRFFVDRVVTKIGYQKTMQIGGLLALIGLSITAISQHYIVTTLALMLVAIGTSCNIPVIYSIAGFKSKTPTDMGVLIISIISFMGFLVGPALIGNIADIFGLRYSFAFITIFGLFITLTISTIHDINRETK